MASATRIRVVSPGEWEGVAMGVARYRCCLGPAAEQLSCEPVWPSGKALVRLVGGLDVGSFPYFGSPFS